MNALITTIINNIFHGIWIGCIAMEPKHSRRKTAMIVAVTVILFELLVIGMRGLWLADAQHSGPAMDLVLLYQAGYLLAALIFGGVYIFALSDFHPAKSLFLLSAYFSLWTLIYITISLVTGTFIGAGTIVIWGLRIGLNLLFLFLYLRFFKQRLLKICREVKSGYGIVTAVSVLAFTVMTILIFYNEKMRSRDIFYMIVVLFVCIFMMGVYVLMFRFIEQSAHVYNMKQLQFHEKTLMAQIDAYEKMAQNARQTRHDFRHHNLVVAEYAKNKDYQGILSYLNEYEKREDDKYAVSFCGNQAINNVLYAYMDQAAVHDITFKTDIRILDTGGISDYDLVSILANILENAVNACMKVEGRREIEMTISQKNFKLIVTCKNTCSSEVLFENGIPRNREHDGVGAESILSSAQKYGGMADFSVIDGIFTCCLILNKGRN